MALIDCPKPECDQTVSDRAKSCPNCGTVLKSDDPSQDEDDGRKPFLSRLTSKWPISELISKWPLSLITTIARKHRFVLGIAVTLGLLPLFNPEFFAPAIKVFSAALALYVLATSALHGVVAWHKPATHRLQHASALVNELVFSVLLTIISLGWAGLTAFLEHPGTTITEFHIFNVKVLLAASLICAGVTIFIHSTTACSKCGAPASFGKAACADCGHSIVALLVSTDIDPLESMRPAVRTFVVHLVVIAIAFWALNTGWVMWDDAELGRGLADIDIEVQQEAIDKNQVPMIFIEDWEQGWESREEGFVSRSKAQQILDEVDECRSKSNYRSDLEAARAHLSDYPGCPSAATGFLATIDRPGMMRSITDEDGWERSFENSLNPTEMLERAKEARKEFSAMQKEALMWLVASGLVAIIALLSSAQFMRRDIPKLRDLLTPQGGQR